MHDLQRRVHCFDRHSGRVVEIQVRVRVIHAPKLIPYFPLPAAYFNQAVPVNHVSSGGLDKVVPILVIIRRVLEPAVRPGASLGVAECPAACWLLCTVRKLCSAADERRRHEGAGHHKQSLRVIPGIKPWWAATACVL